MASLINPEALSTFLRYSKPQTTLDLASLAAIGVASATYLVKGTPWNRPDPYYNQWFERPQFKDGFQSNRPAATRNIAEKLEQTNQRVVIFWGSQSGTSEIFAHKLARECHLRYGVDAIALDLSDYDPETISQIPDTKLAIFILSTFGEGDPSDNTAGLWSWLHKGPPTVSLPTLQYAAFGLGNSNYKYYNRVVDVVVESLEKAGAKAFMPVGKADDANGGTEEDFLAWKTDLFTVFQENLGCQEREIIYAPALAVREDPSLEPIDLHHGVPIEQHSGSKGKSVKTSPVRALAVTEARELYTTPTRNCVHLELDLGSHSELRYKTGDYLVVYPIAPDAEVDGLLRALGWQEKAETPLLISALEDGAASNIPSPTSANAILRYYIDICGPVARDIVKDLAQFAPTPDARELLLTLGKNKDAYQTFTRRNYVTLGRLLSLAAPGVVWKDLPLSYLLETIPPTQPRYYSIASSSIISARRLAITVGVEKKPLADEPSTEIKGLTTNYLLALSNSFQKTETSPLYQLAGPTSALEGHKIHAAIRKSKFKLPTLPSTPIIMVAAGTGIAAFRGFIQERTRLKSIGKPVGPMVLFFGCRNPEEDYLYRQELEEARAELGGAFEIVTAFSRVAGQEKQYVQDAIRYKAKDFCELLDQDASLYVCGRASMAREVGKTVQDMLMAQHGWDESQLRKWSDSMKRGSKWLEDVWG
ncbi:hypothetical protein ANO14919_108900 [Xylariales sp. No.14919]|nr:hypothetical protein ANO14919_108900 [Xylariales sp. No.14919]